MDTRAEARAAQAGVSQYAPNRDSADQVDSQGPLGNGRRRGGGLIGPDLGVGEVRVVVDRHAHRPGGRPFRRTRGARHGRRRRSACGTRRWARPAAHPQRGEGGPTAGGGSPGRRTAGRGCGQRDRGRCGPPLSHDGRLRSSRQGRGTRRPGTSDPREPQPLPPKTRHLGCKKVANDGSFGG